MPGTLAFQFGVPSFQGRTLFLRLLRSIENITILTALSHFEKSLSLQN
jgi:hypothetical protein